MAFTRIVFADTRVTDCVRMIGRLEGELPCDGPPIELILRCAAFPLSTFCMTIGAGLVGTVNGGTTADGATSGSDSAPVIDALRLLRNSNRSGTQAGSSLAAEASSPPPSSAVQNADKSGIASIGVGNGLAFFGADGLLASDTSVTFVT